MTIKNIKTKFGIMDRHSRESWQPYYDLYLKGEILSFPDLAIYLEISIKSLRTIFNNLGFKPLSISETSKRCSIKNKETCLERYGVSSNLQLEEVIEKSKKSRIAKYGDSCVFNNSEVIRKRDEKNLKKYGVACTLQAEEVKKKLKEKYGNESAPKCADIQEKISKTNKNRYGNSCVLQSDEIKIKIKETISEKYGTGYASQNKEVRKRIARTRLQKTENYWINNYLKPNGYLLMEEFRGVFDKEMSYIKYEFKHKDCGRSFKTYLATSQPPKCPYCFPNQSSMELKYRKYFDSLNVRYLANDKSLIRPLELDLVVLDNSLAFEFNGDYWHSTIHDRVGKKYHKNKTELALANNIKLYHIWEHDNIEIVKSMIKSKLGKIDNKYYARKLDIKEVSTKERQLFFDTNHLHGDVKSKFALGLYNGDELISCISFRAHKEGIEIARFATKLNSSCIGGFSKLLKHSIFKLKSLGYSKIITYCDRDWTPDYKDSTYFKNGFKFVGDTGCTLSYFCSRGNTVHCRESLQKHKLRELFPENYDNSLTADEILYKNNFYPLYNSGNWKYEKEI